MRMRMLFSSLMAAGLVVAVGMASAPAAFADSGSKPMMRKGRLVWRVPSAPKEKATPQAPRPRDQRGVTYDKGSLGTYVRHGRTVTKVCTAAVRSSAGKTDYDATRHRVLDHAKHKHYLP